jgi:hypothetical protein
VVELGKQHFGAADNSPAASPPDGTSGPWWSIGIAGYHEDTSEGREALSGSLPDFVGDFTQDLPYCHDCESGTRSVSGTSFATPRSAGTFSAVLLEARRATGHTGGIATEPRGGGMPLMVERKRASGLAGGGLTNWDLRCALEEGAYYPTTAEYDPLQNIEEDLTAVPINDVAPWAQAGWGAITPDPEHGVVGETLAHTGIAQFGPPTRFKSELTCAFMTLNIEARHAYWDTVRRRQRELRHHLRPVRVLLTPVPPESLERLGERRPNRSTGAALLQAVDRLGDAALPRLLGLGSVDLQHVP